MLSSMVIFSPVIIQMAPQLDTSAMFSKYSLQPSVSSGLIRWTESLRIVVKYDDRSNHILYI